MAVAVMHELSTRLCGLRNAGFRATSTETYKHSTASQGECGPVTVVVHRSVAGEVVGFLGYRLAAGADGYGRPARNAACHRTVPHVRCRRGGTVLTFVANSLVAQGQE